MTAIEKKTFENLYLHLNKLAKQDPEIFQFARELLADKLDYVDRHHKQSDDAKRMFVAALVKMTGYRPKEYNFRLKGGG